jgi:hypothetical protein
MRSSTFDGSRAQALAWGAHLRAEQCVGHSTIMQMVETIRRSERIGSTTTGRRKVVCRLTSMRRILLAISCVAATRHHLTGLALALGIIVVPALA